MKKGWRVFALFISIFLRNRSLSNGRWFYGKRKIGKGNLYLTENQLTGGNWQKWKRVFLTCPCHEIYRDEAVCLKSCKNTWKLRYLWKCEIWGKIVKMWYFVNNCLIKAWIKKILLHSCDTYNYDYLKYSTFRFNFIDFQLYIDFPFQFCVFYRKIT